jgi:type I restriction enzyme S subunit
MAVVTKPSSTGVGYKQTEVGLIPGDWDVALLDSVAKRGSGHTPDRNHPEYWDGDIKWISLKDSDRLDALYIDDTTDRITPAGIANSSATLHPAGTVVLSRDAGVGKSAIMTDAMAVSQHFMAWVCGPRLDNRFLYYWLQAKKAEFERIAFGNTIKTIGLAYFKKLKIPLPQLKEQQKISAALTDMGAVISELANHIAKKRDVKTAARQQLLTGKRRLPGFGGDWEVKRLGELLAYEQPGKYLVKSAEYDDSNDTPVVTAGKTFILGYTSDQTGIFTNLPVVIFDDFTTASRYVDFPFKAKSSAMKMLRPRDEQTNLRFLFEKMQLIRFPLGDHKRYWISEYQDLEVPVPRKAEQGAIAAVLADIDGEISGLEDRRQKSWALKQGMMQQLLTGSIRLV